MSKFLLLRNQPKQELCMSVCLYVCMYVCVGTTHPTQHEDSVRRLSSFQEMVADHVTLVQYVAVQLAGIQKLALTPSFLMPTSYITPIILCITGDITHLRSGASGWGIISGSQDLAPRTHWRDPVPPDPRSCCPWRECFSVFPSAYSSSA